MGCGPRGGQGHDAELHYDAAGRRPYGGDGCGRADAEVVGGGQRSGDRADGGGGFHSAYWDDTAIFILEDDAQNGADHVDAHRSLALAISKYAPRAADGGPFVDSRFYSTVSVVRTMETLLGLPPMNNNDALASLMASEFSGPGDQKPFAADTANRDNGLIYTANGPRAVGARESAKMDFTHADRADARS
jgi:hypothetical protein